jgi:hypothetical protein
MIRFTFAILLTVGFFSCSENASNKETPNNWKHYGTRQFSIDFPQDWKLNETPQSGVLFNIMAPIDTEKDDFRENVNLITQDLTDQPMDLNAFVQLSEKQINSMGKIASLISSKRIKTAKGTYHSLYYNYKPSPFQLTIEQHIWIKESKAYILTFTGEQEGYVQYREISQQILNSFVFK